MSKRIAARLLLVVLSTALSIKVADLIVGWVDPAGISHFANKRRFDSTALRNEPVPNTAGIQVLVPGTDLQAGVRYRVNSLGFRGREYAPEPPEGAFRVVLLGDSVTFGWGVEGEDTFAEVLERRLAARDPTRTWEVCNLAIPGYESSHQFYRWQTLGKTLKPDLVLVIFNQNDVQLAPDELLGLTALANERLAQAGWLEQRVRTMLLDEPWKSRFERLLPNLRHVALFQFLFRTTPADEQTLTDQFAQMTGGIRTSLAFLAKLRERVEGTGAKFAVCDLQHFAAIEEGCADAGIAYRSIVYDGYLSDMSLRNSPADPHPNAAGHLRLADRLEWALDDLSLLPERDR